MRLALLGGFGVGGSPLYRFLPAETGQLAALTYVVAAGGADNVLMMFLFSFDWPNVADYLFVRVAACLGASYVGVVAMVWVEKRIERLRLSPEATVAPGHTTDS